MVRLTLAIAPSTRDRESGVIVGLDVLVELLIIDLETEVQEEVVLVPSLIVEQHLARLVDDDHLLLATGDTLGVVAVRALIRVIGQRQVVRHLSDVQLLGVLLDSEELVVVHFHLLDRLGESGFLVEVVVLLLLVGRGLLGVGGLLALGALGGLLGVEARVALRACFGLRLGDRELLRLGRGHARLEHVLVGDVALRDRLAHLLAGIVLAARQRRRARNRACPGVVLLLVRVEGGRLQKQERRNCEQKQKRTQPLKGEDRGQRTGWQCDAQ